MSVCAAGMAQLWAHDWGTSLSHFPGHTICGAWGLECWLGKHCAAWHGRGSHSRLQAGACQLKSGERLAVHGTAAVARYSMGNDASMTEQMEGHQK